MVAPALMRGQGGTGGANAADQIRAAIATLNSDKATPQQKNVAKQTAIRLVTQYGGTMNNILQQAGWQVSGNKLLYRQSGQGGQGGQWVEANWNSTGPVGANGSAQASPTNQWDAAVRAASDNNQPTMHNTSSALPYDPMRDASSTTGGNTNGLYDDAANGAASGPGFDGGFQSGGQASSGSIRDTKPQYGGTFFGGVQDDALDELQAHPEQAWQLFRTRGGPGGGSLANSTASLYGQNNFMSNMALGDILGGPGKGPEDVLGFANDAMSQDMRGGGRYTDPAKILNAAFANIGKESDAFSQQDMILQTLDALEPYMSSGEYERMRRRTQRAIDEYMAYGLENGQSDLSGRLLQSIQQAIGM